MDSRFSSWEDRADGLVLWVPSLSHVLVVMSATHKNKRQDMVYDRSQFFFFILNDISKEKNLTFILKIPTRLTGIKSLFVMESPSLPFLSSARTCTHTNTLSHSGRARIPSSGGSWTNCPACGTEVN